MTTLLLTALVNLLVGVALSSSGFLAWARARLGHVIKWIKQKILRQKDAA